MDLGQGFAIFGILVALGLVGIGMYYLVTLKEDDKYNKVYVTQLIGGILSIILGVGTGVVMIPDALNA